MEAVRVTIEGPRADIVLNRPDVLNAMDFSVFDGLAAAADAVAAAPDVRVVVVSGEGRAFSSGIDVSALGPIAGDVESTVARAQAGFRKIAALEMPTIARVHGYAFGAGLQLALACDLRVAARDAKLGVLEANYGLIPDLIGSTRLPQLVGPGRAKRLTWLAEKIDATEAERIGLIEWVVDPAELGATVDGLVARLLEGSATAQRESKMLIEASNHLSVAAGMDAEATAQIRCMTAPEFAETLMKGMQRVSARKT